jgi:quercetin 2,3-dioxygenase
MIFVLPENQQQDGQFNNGKILEKRPVMLSAGKGSVNPYSNIFYWAHAWSDEGSLLGEHPHQGFDILTFILKGEIEHYDNHYKKWKKLKEGSAQIIRAGKGISHAEKFLPGAEIFQIWLDPNLKKTLSLPPEYEDYPSDVFPAEEKNKMRIKVYTDGKSPIITNTPSVEIKEILFEDGEHEYELNYDKIYSLFLIEGIIKIKGEELNKNDFALLKEETKIIVESSGRSRLFIIVSPLILEYDTYADQFA